jgi:2-hydroxychromene-2-carboxylate isomerase
MRTEIGRFVARHGIPFAQNPHFPVNTLTIMRGAVAYQTEGDFDVYVRTMFEGMWVHGRGLDQPHEIAAVLDAAGLDAAAFADRVADPAVKGRLRANTEDAVARGVFGAPTFFVGDDMFFGQDRLDWVEAALGVGG